jgi:predicted thioesterase
MKTNLNLGAQRTYTHVVGEGDTARFHAEETAGGGEIHPLYATFAIGRDAEWACRLFVLELKEDDEEGIGSALTINHEAPAPLGATVIFTATLTELHGNTVVCDWEAHWGETRIAHGTQTQRVLPKAKLNSLMDKLFGKKKLEEKETELGG